MVILNNQENLSNSNEATKKDISTMLINGAIGITEQIPWIQNQTLKENVLFFNEYIKEKYEKIIEITQLKSDIKNLPGNDMTEIGDRGINLSGGQKARVSLARAIYVDKDIYLFDDPLASLDADVGKKVFTECFINHLKRKTRVLATHNIQYLNFFDRIIWMNKGEITFMGNFIELEKQEFYIKFMSSINSKKQQSITVAKRTKVFSCVNLVNMDYFINSLGLKKAQILNSVNILNNIDKKSDNIAELGIINDALESVNKKIDEYKPLDNNALSKKRSSFIIENIIKDLQKDLKVKNLQEFVIKNQCETKIEQKSQILIDKKSKQMNKPNVKKNDNDNHSIKEKVHRITKDEDQETGAISYDVYFRFFNYFGGIKLILMVLLILVCWQGLKVYSDIFLADWTKVANQDPTGKWVYYGIFSSFALGSTIFIFLRLWILNNGALRMAYYLHYDMMTSLTCAPINLFFDATPRGQIYNRLSKDLENVNQVVSCLGHILSRLFSCVGVFVISFIYAKFSLVFISILGFVAYIIYKYYVNASRNMERLSAITLSPMINIVSEAFQGTNSIRAFKAEEGYKAKFYKKADENLKILLFKNGITTWFNFYIEIVAIGFLLCLLVFVIYSRDNIDSQSIGLMLIYSLRLKIDLFTLILNVVSFQNKIISLERCTKYTTLPQEAAMETERDEHLKSPFIIKKSQGSENTKEETKVQYYRNKYDDSSAKVNEIREDKESKTIWPSKGVIVFENYSVKYRPDTPIILNQLSFKINSFEKIGIVGRTGSGKSTICNSIFRILEPLNGKILIDGEDIMKIGLQNLRRNITIIPQDPCIFANSLKYNVDPFNQHKDEEITEVFNMLGFDNPSFKEGIYSFIKDKDSLSVGERQLICIARAIVRVLNFFYDRQKFVLKIKRMYLYI